MSGCRDWISTHKQAAYRGVPFFVETNKVSPGQRLHVHEFMYSDTPYIEPLGQRAAKISVTAYVAGDEADSEAKALTAACLTAGAGRLVLPLEEFMVQCESCPRNFSKDKFGFIAFDLTFIREGAGERSSAPAAYLGQLVEWAARSVTGPLGGFLASGFRTFGYSSFVKESAADTIRDVAATLIALTERVRLDEDKGPELNTAITNLFAEADDLGQYGGRGDDYSSTSYSRKEFAAPDVPLLASRLVDVFELTREAMAAEDAIEVFGELTAYQPAETLTPITPSGQRETANSAVLATAVRTAAAASYGAALVAREYTIRREVVAARATSATVFDAVLQDISVNGGNELFEAMTDIAGSVAQHMTVLLTELQPVLIVESGVSLPSLYWAQRIYGDASRAQELSSLNRVKHPSFMPFRFEAIAA
jgi:hypothetical protein